MTTRTIEPSCRHGAIQRGEKKTCIVLCSSSDILFSFFQALLFSTLTQVCVVMQKINAVLCAVKRVYETLLCVWVCVLFFSSGETVTSRPVVDREEIYVCWGRHVCCARSLQVVQHVSFPQTFPPVVLRMVHRMVHLLFLLFFSTHPIVIYMFFSLPPTKNLWKLHKERRPTIVHLKLFISQVLLNIVIV